MLIVQRLFSQLSLSSLVTGTRDVLEWKVSSSECGNIHEISLAPLLTLHIIQTCSPRCGTSCGI